MWAFGAAGNVRTVGTPTSRARWLRGALVGVTSAVLTVGAHATAGGGIPNGGALIISLLICAALGSMVGCLRLEGRGARWLGTATALGAAQLLGHLTLMATGHQHYGNQHYGGGELALSPSMIATHTGAAVILAVAIAAAEYLYVVCSSVLCWLRLFALTEGARAARATRAVARDFVAQSVLRCRGVGMRAPPVGSAVV